MSVVYAKIDTKQKEKMAKYWQYHFDSLEGKIKLPTFENAKYVPLDERGIRSWRRFLFGDVPTEGN